MRSAETVASARRIGSLDRFLARITEIPAGESTHPLKFALDEVVYVVAGRGLTTIWYNNSSAKKSFEWQQHSMFLLPHGCHHTFSNMQGDRPVRLLHAVRSGNEVLPLPEKDGQDPWVMARYAMTQ